MSSALTLLLAALSGSTLAIIIIVTVLLQHPEKLQLWAAWMWRGIRLLSKRAEYRYVAADVAAHINDQLARDLGSNIDGLGVPSIVIRWTNDASAVASQTAGTLIVRMHPHEDRVSNLLHASLAATQRIVAPTLRPQMLPAQSKAIDLQLCRRLAEHLSDTAVTEYRLDILQPALEATPGLEELLRQFNSIDLGGLFLPVLLQELTKVATASPIDSLPELSRDFTRFSEFLLTVAQRAAGADVELSYEGIYFRVNILLVARMETRLKGVGPYRARVSRELAKNIDAFYVMATEANIPFAEEVARALDADRRLIRSRTKKLVIERTGRRVNAVLVPFERNTGFATAEFFREVISANVYEWVAR